MWATNFDTHKKQQEKIIIIIIIIIIITGLKYMSYKLLDNFGDY
jgi:hypothetical protein